MIKILLRAAFCLSLPCAILSCNNGDKTSPTSGLATFNKDSLAATIKTLASDDFQGRRPFTAGETKTIDYLTKAYSALGLHSSKGPLALQNMTDFVCWTERPDTLDALHDNDVVFAGFGIVAPE